MSLPLFIIFLLTFVFTVSSQSTTFTIGLGAPTLLSGGLTACLPNATVATCTGGLATLVAYGRNLTRSNATNFLTIIPQLDVSSPFVQMHPNGLSVNIDVHRYVGISSFFAYPSFFSQNVNFERFYNYTATPIATNLNVPSSNQWRHFVKDFEVFEVESSGVRVAVTRTLQTGQIWVDAAAPALIATINNMRRVAGVVVLIGGDIDYPYNQILPLLGDDLPDVFIDMSASTTSTSFTSYRPPNYNGTGYTLVGTVSATSSGVFVNFVINATKQLASAYYTPVDLTALSAALKDADYFAFQDYLRTQALMASTNDPILSHTTEAVSKSRLDGYYPCLAGECAQGTLYTAAYRWRYNADFGLTNSGGPRGPGWPAGPVRTSDVWALMPFNNYPCTGTVLGLKVWELVNTSLAYLTFLSTYNSVGDRFLQTFGLQIDYDNSSLSVQAGTRVRAIRVRDRTTGEYKPLERLKYYTFATDTYQCTGMPVISGIISHLYDGESIDTSASDELVQTSIQSFLKANNPYEPVFQNYLQSVPASSVSDFMAWAQTARSCSTTSRWSAGLGTCIDCPAGSQRDGSDATLCVPIPLAPEADRTVVNVLVPIVVVLAVVLTCVVVAGWWRSGQNVRNTRCAPKGEAAAIIFTDIQMSTKLWGTVPASMGVALDQHHAMIREAIRAHSAYEVKTVGDSFMIAVDSAQRAVDLSLQIQTDFMNAKWPRCIDQAYAAESMPEYIDLIDDNPADLTTEGIEGPEVKMMPLEDSISDKKPAPHMSKDFHGIRVRIGIHYGPVDTIFDEISKGYDYYGSTVNLASRIESSADGGQIVMSRAVANLIQNDDAVFRVELLGEAELKGIIGSTELLQILPVPLVTRVFTAKAIDKIQGQNDALQRSTNSSKASVNGIPILNDREFLIKDYIMKALKPLKADVHQKQIEQLSKAWHIRSAKHLTEGEKQEMTFSVIAQRVAATRRPSKAADRLAADSSAIMMRYATSTSVKVFEDGGL